MSGFTFKVEAVEVERGKIFRHEVCSPSDSFSANHLKKSQHLEAFYMSSALPVPLNQQNRSYFDREFDHGLVHACLISFTQHKRLVLRPDDIFFPLVDAAAAHVLNQGESARGVFVNHTGQKNLSVTRNGFAPPGGTINANDWLGALPEFRAQIVANTHPGSTDAALPNFTTTDVVCAAAYSGTLMRALQKFFAYRMMTMCGMPSITLLGSEGDWSDLRARFLKLAETWMGRTPSSCDWAAAVDQMLSQFESARAGRVDVEWWKSFFTYHGAKGSGSTPYITGHITCLFPWTNTTWHGLQKALRNVPCGISSVPLEWNYLGVVHPMLVWSGISGICTDEEQESVAPAMGVAVTWVQDVPKADRVEENE